MNYTYIIVYLTVNTQTASSLLAGKPTFVAVGAIDTLPYADELGL